MPPRAESRRHGLVTELVMLGALKTGGIVYENTIAAVFFYTLAKLLISRYSFPNTIGLHHAPTPIPSTPAPQKGACLAILRHLVPTLHNR